MKTREGLLKQRRNAGNDRLPPFPYRPLSIAIAACLSASFASAASANPQGGVVVGGQASISQAPGVTTVNQGTTKAVIDWQKFGIDRGELTQFKQPGKDAIALNRVVGKDPSSILGQLKANGNVWLVNRNGVLVGPGAQIDVHGFMATTADIDNEDFLAGHYEFSKPSPNTGAAVVNQGTITIGEHGLGALVAPHARNDGVIQGQLGKVVIAGTPTYTVDFYGDGLIQFEATSKVKEAPDTDRALAENSGTISVDGGTVIITADAIAGVVDEVINLDGVVEARSFAVEQGTIVLDGGDSGIVKVAGRLDASGQEPGAKGGSIKVLGEKVGLFAGGKVDVSGDAGGGEVLVGGNLRGRGPESNAKQTYVDANAVIHADALGDGDGGQVIVWSDKTTRMHGEITARGGEIVGGGGFVETSSGAFLAITATPDVSASAGPGGTWLIDPHDVDIVEGTGDTSQFDDSPFVAIEDDAQLGVDLITSALTGGVNVIVSTGTTGEQEGDITFFADLNYDGTGSNTLTLEAADDINISDQRIFDSVPGDDSLTVVVNADRDASGAGAIVMAPGSEISSNGGDVVLGGGRDPLNDPAYGTAVFIDGIILDGATIDSGNGDISLRGIGFRPGDGDVGSASGVDIRNNSAITSTDGNISITGLGGGSGTGIRNRGINLQEGARLESTGSGSLTLNGTGGVGSDDATGVFLDSAVLSSADGAIRLTGVGGDVTGTIDRGIRLQNEALVESTRGGVLFLDGTPGGADTFGILATDRSRVVSSGIVTLEGGSWDISLTDSGNDFGTVMIGNARNAVLSDGNDVVISSTTVSGDLNLDALGQILIEGGLDVGRNLVLDAGLSVTQTAPITAAGLALSGDGFFSLTDPGNNIETLAASALGGIEYLDANDLAIAEVGGVSGIRTDSANVTVRTVDGSLSVDGPVDSGTETLELQAGGAGSNLALNDNVLGRSVVLRAGNTISQTSDSAITATNLGVEATAAPSLNLGGSDIDVLAANITGEGNAFAFTDVSDLQVGQVGALTGITVNNGLVSLDVGGDLLIGEPLSSGTTSTLTLVSGGTVTQSAPVTAAGLAVFSNGLVGLTDPRNNVETLAASALAGIEYVDANDLTIAEVGGVSGIRSDSANVIVGTVDGSLRVDRSVSTAGLEGGSSDVMLRTGEATETTAANLTLFADVVGETVQLVSADAIIQAEGAVFASGLGLVAAEAAVLEQDNNVEALAGNVEGALSFRDIDGFAIDTVAGTLGLTGGSTISVNADGFVDGFTPIAVPGLELLGTGPYFLSANNDVQTLAGNISGAVNYTDINGFAIGSVGSSSGLSTSQGIILQANGEVTQIEALSGSSLELFGAGPYFLTNPSNGVNTLAAETLGVIQYTDADDLRLVPLFLFDDEVASLAGEAIRTADADVSVRTVAGPLSVDGAVDIGTATLELQASGAGSNLALNDNVLGRSVVLRADNAISQTADSAITATNLGVEAAAAPSLDLGGNDVSVLAANITGEGNAFAFTDVSDLQVGQVGTLTGITVNNGAVSLEVGGDLLISEPLTSGTAGTLSLVSDGAVTQTAPLTAGGLALLGAGSFQMLSPGNDAQTITGNVSGSVAYRDANDLTIGSPSETPLSGITAQAVQVFVGGELTLEAPIIASSAGNSIVIDASRFINNAGGSSLDPGAGRFLVYSTTESEDARGDLDALSGILGSRTIESDPPESVADPDPVLEEADLFLYEDHLGTLLVSARPVEKTYGDPNPDPLPHDIDFTALIDDHTKDQAVSGEPVLTTDAEVTSVVDDSPFDVRVDLGTLSSYLGYELVADSTRTDELSIETAPIDAVVANAFAVDGDSVPTFSATFTGFKLEDDETDLGEISFAISPDDAILAVDNSPYSITVTGFESTNYSLDAVVPGELTVTTASIGGPEALPPLPPFLLISNVLQPDVPVDEELSSLFPYSILFEDDGTLLVLLGGTDSTSATLPIVLTDEQGMAVAVPAVGRPPIDSDLLYASDGNRQLWGPPAPANSR